MDEPLSAYLDRLIEAAYVTVERGEGYSFHHPSEEAIEDLIEDPDLGRPVPIDDSADHYLLLSFDRARREHWTKSPVPDWNFNVNGTAALRGNQKFDGNVFQGEIPWGTMHRNGKNVR